jgi:predicted AAA+ superfamily ATPase
MIKRQTYIDKIAPFIDSPVVKILTGIRRCGKSTLLKAVMGELCARGVSDKRIVLYSFDSLAFSHVKTAATLYEDIASTYSKDERIYLFFDEIQEVEEWETVINSLLSDMDADIYVTGSNSKLLSSEISSRLTGRYVTIPVFTLSFEEFRDFRYGSGADYASAPPTPREDLAVYIRQGGFPIVSLKSYSDEEAYSMVRDIYNSCVFTDIVRRYGIRKVDLFERIVKFVFDNLGQTFSALAISKYLKNENRKVDSETVYEYLKKLEEAFIIYRCSRYDLKGKEILKTQEKFYLADSALRYAVLGYSVDSVAAMLENVVYLELLRRGYTVCVGKYDNYEIDFVAERQGDRLYIQIAQDILSDETEGREYGRLLGIKDNYPKYVLCASEYAGGNYRGITTMHVADFLLSDW